MICLKCNREIDNAAECPHCGANMAFEMQKKTAVAVRLGTKRAAEESLGARFGLYRLIGNIATAVLSLFIAMMLINLFIASQLHDLGDGYISYINATSLILLVPVVYLIFSATMSVVSMLRMRKSGGDPDAAVASGSCMYLVALKLVNKVFWLIATIIALCLALVLSSSAFGALNQLNDLNDIVIMRNTENSKEDISFGELVEESLAEGGTYYTAVYDAIEYITKTASQSPADADSDGLSTEQRKRNEDIAFYALQARMLDSYLGIPDDIYIVISYSDASQDTKFGDYVARNQESRGGYLAAYSDAFNLLVKTAFMEVTDDVSQERQAQLKERIAAAEKQVSSLTNGKDAVIVRDELNPEFDITVYDYIKLCMDQGKTYQASLVEAYSLLENTRDVSELTTNEHPELSEDWIADRNARLAKYASHAENLLKAKRVNLNGMASANLWLGSMLDLFSIGAHKDVNDFAARINPFLAILLALGSVLICGASFHFLPIALKRSILYFDSVHRARKEGLYEKKNTPPHIHLYIFGGLFIALAAVVLILTLSFGLIDRVAYTLGEATRGAFPSWLFMLLAFLFFLVFSVAYILGARFGKRLFVRINKPVTRIATVAAAVGAVCISFALAMILSRAINPAASYESWQLTLMLILGIGGIVVAAALTAVFFFLSRGGEKVDNGFSRMTKLPSILLLSFTAFFLIMTLTCALPYISATLASAVGHISLALLLAVIGGLLITNGLDYLLTHRRILKAIRRANEENALPAAMTFPEVVEIEQADKE